MREIWDIRFVRICVMRRYYNSKFNELTPMGLVVLCVAGVFIVILVFVVVMLVRIII